MEPKFKIGDRVVTVGDGHGTVQGVRLYMDSLLYLVKNDETGNTYEWTEHGLTAYIEPQPDYQYEIKTLTKANEILKENLTEANKKIDTLRKRAEEAEKQEDRADRYYDAIFHRFLQKVKSSGIEEAYIDQNCPWRIMIVKNKGIYALAAKADHGAVGDGEQKDADAIVAIFNEAVRLAR